MYAHTHTGLLPSGKKKVILPFVTTLTNLEVVLCFCACAQSCPTLCNPMDCSPSCSFVQGIFLVRILEWVVMSSSRESSWPRDWTCISYVSCIGRQILYHQHHLGSPWKAIMLSKIRQRKTNTLWSHLHIKSKKLTRLVVARGKGWWVGETWEGYQKGQAKSYKIINARDCSMVTKIIDNTVVFESC